MSKTDRNRIICQWYHDGTTVTEIAKRIGLAPCNTVQLLKLWYPKFYDTPYVGKLSDEYKNNFYRNLYERYTAVYKPFMYSNSEMCRVLGCNIHQLYKMFEIYEIDHQRLKTYKSQKTLCNVPDEFLNELKLWCKKHNTSIRKVAVTAINEYILFNE